MKCSSYTNLFILLVVMISVAVSGCNLRPHGPMDFAGWTPFSGGQAFKLPVVTRYSTNITPDQVAKHREEE